MAILSKFNYINWFVSSLSKLGSLITLSLWWLVIQMVLDVAIACEFWPGLVPFQIVS